MVTAILAPSDESLAPAKLLRAVAQWPGHTLLTLIDVSLRSAAYYSVTAFKAAFELLYAVRMQTVFLFVNEAKPHETFTI